MSKAIVNIVVGAVMGVTVWAAAKLFSVPVGLGVLMYLLYRPTNIAGDDQK